MPELPEVETVMRGLGPILVGRSIAAVELRRAGLRFPFPAGFAARLKGRRVVSLQRRAKYILVNLDDGHCLLVHLGMTGRFTVLDENAPPNNLGEFYYEQGAVGAGSGPHDHVVFLLDNGVRVVYTDHRRFGVMDLLHENEMAGHKLLKGIGVEPLGNEFSADFLAARFRKKSAPLKAALLDQRIIAGLGNIYATEILYRSGIHPETPAGEISLPRLSKLAAETKAVPKQAIAMNGTSISDFRRVDDKSGGFQNFLQIYQKDTCPKGHEVKKIKQGGRGTFFCPVCQK